MGASASAFKERIFRKNLYELSSCRKVFGRSFNEAVFYNYANDQGLINQHNLHRILQMEHDVYLPYDLGGFETEGGTPQTIVHRIRDFLKNHNLRLSDGHGFDIDSRSLIQKSQLVMVFITEAYFEMIEKNPTYLSELEIITSQKNCGVIPVVLDEAVSNPEKWSRHVSKYFNKSVSFTIIDKENGTFEKSCQDLISYIRTKIIPINEWGLNITQSGHQKIILSNILQTSKPSQIGYKSLAALSVNEIILIFHHMGYVSYDGQLISHNVDGLLLNGLSRLEEFHEIGMTGIPRIHMKRLYIKFKHFQIEGVPLEMLLPLSHRLTMESTRSSGYCSELPAEIQQQLAMSVDSSFSPSVVITTPDDWIGVLESLSTTPNATLLEQLQETLPLVISSNRDKHRALGSTPIVAKNLNKMLSTHMTSESAIMSILSIIDTLCHWEITDDTVSTATVDNSQNSSLTEFNELLGSFGGCERLLDILKSHERVEPVIQLICGILRNLCLNNTQNEIRCCNHGALELFTSLLQNYMSNKVICRTVCGVLRNLSSQSMACQQQQHGNYDHRNISMFQVFRDLLERSLDADDTDFILELCLIIRNLCCNNPHNCIEFGEVGICEVLLNVLEVFRMNTEILCEACHVIVNLIITTPENHHKFVNKSGFNIMISILRNNEDVERLVSVCCWIIRILCTMNVVNRKLFEETGGCEVLITLFSRYCDDCHCNDEIVGVILCLSLDSVRNRVEFKTGNVCDILDKLIEIENISDVTREWITQLLYLLKM